MDRVSNDSDLLIPDEEVDEGRGVDTSIDQQPSFFFDHASRIEHIDDGTQMRNTSNRLFTKRRLPGGNINNTTFQSSEDSI